MFFSDNAGRAVARFIRPNPWFLQKMEITAAGATIGYILQKRDKKIQFSRYAMQKRQLS